MPATRAELLAYIDGLGIPTKTYEHPAVFTVAESLAIEKIILGGHTKNLFLKDKRTSCSWWLRCMMQPSR